MSGIQEKEPFISSKELAIFNNAVVAMLILDSSGHITTANTSSEKLFKTTSPLKGTLLTSLFLGDPPNEYYSWFALKKQKYPLQITIELKNGKEERFHCDATFTRMPHKSTIAILCQLQPNNNTLNNLPDVQYQYHLLNNLINNIPDNIFIKDINGKYILVNNYVADMIGAKTTDDIIGKTDFDIYPKKLAQKYYENELQIINSGIAKLNIVEQIVNRKYGIQWYSTSKLPLTNNNKIIGIMGIGRNITSIVKEQKAIRRAKNNAEKANQLKVSFLANLSHEIRTPLNGILGFSQFLAQNANPHSKEAQYINHIIHNGKNLLALLTNMIDISKINSGQLELNIKPCNVSELLYALQDYCQKLLIDDNKTHIDLTVHVESDIEEFIFQTDEVRLRQILKNLLENAVKFTDNGSIHLSCTKKSDNLHFSVEDTGIGIKKENWNIIFDRFTQVDNSHARKYEGAGLGLSIVKGLTELLGGEIHLSSSLKQGSNFILVHPISNPLTNIASSNHKKQFIILGTKPKLKNFYTSEYCRINFNMTHIQDSASLPPVSEVKADFILCNYSPENITMHEFLKEYLSDNPKTPYIGVIKNSSDKAFYNINQTFNYDYIIQSANGWELINKIKKLMAHVSPDYSK